MEEATVVRALVRDKVADVPGIGGWTVLVVSDEDRRNQLEARRELRSICEQALARTTLDQGTGEGQILLSVLEYLSGEEAGGV
jgi:hypothetical protein